jgi:glycosyltransferase involved in cell wall biosynthesis
MRIGFVVYGDLETRTGGFRYDRRLIAGLRERGDRVDVISLPWRRYPRGLFDGLSTRLADRLDGPFDVLLEDELAHPSLVGLNRRLRARSDVPIVSVVHHLRCSEDHSSPARWWYRTVEQRYLGALDGAICNSESTRTTVERLAGPALQTTVAPPAGDRFDPAIDAREIERRAREPGPLRTVFVGSIVQRKGLDSLIAGLSRLPGDSWTLRVVGSPDADPGYARKVRRQVARLGLGSRVSFAGELADAALADALRASHVLAVPSTHEGFGIAYLEGMGFGLPALASAAGGAREIVDHGETGYLLRPNAPAEIARALRTLATDREHLARMGSGARERFERQPGWAENTARVRRFLERVADATTANATPGGADAVDGRDGSGPSGTDAAGRGGTDPGETSDTDPDESRADPGIDDGAAVDGKRQERGGGRRVGL